MDRLRLMETFVRVVETGNFSAVAREERTTQSAVSKQVQALETMLGAKLLVRSTRSHALTEAGKRYYERCRQVLDTLEEARVEVQRTETRSRACCAWRRRSPSAACTSCRA
jgi:DNA-binding transcriptional LysR family regulator